MTVTFRQGVAATISCIIALAGFMLHSSNPPTPNLSTQFPITSISAQLTPVKVYLPSGQTVWMTYSPAGPTYMVTMQAAQSGLPITKIRVRVDVSIFLEDNEHVLDFPQVNEGNPLLPGGSVSQNVTFIGPVFVSDIVTIYGSLSDGQTFCYETTIKWQN